MCWTAAESDSMKMTKKEVAEWIALSGAHLQIGALESKIKISNNLLHLLVCMC